MKKILGLIIIITSINSFCQNADNTKSFSYIEIGALAGVNFSTLMGGSAILESKTNLNPNLYVKLSIGYSTLNKKEGYTVDTYRFVSFENYHKYSTYSYDVDEINYDVFPISIGLEYYIIKDKFSPYSLFEIGYNYYSYHTVISNGKIGFDGVYDTYDELPNEFKNKPPVIPQDESYRIAFGLGTNYKLSSSINLDFRLVYQFNKSLVNTIQILIGLNF